MKIDFSKTINDYDDKPIVSEVEIKDAQGEVTTPAKYWTLKIISVNSLSDVKPEDRVDGTVKMERAELARKIHRSTEPLDITPEQAALLKSVIGKLWPPVFVLSAYEQLNGS